MSPSGHSSTSDDASSRDSEPFIIDAPCDADWCTHHEMHPDTMGPGEYEHRATVGAGVTLHLDGQLTPHEYTARIVSFRWSGGESEQICLADADGTVALVLPRDEVPALIHVLGEAVAAFDVVAPRSEDTTS